MLISRSAIFRNAWADYRFQMKWRDDRSFDRALFASLLRHQWVCAKADAAAEAARSVEAARLAVASPAEARAAAIRSELRDMELASDFINWSRHAALGAELAHLNA